MKTVTTKDDALRLALEALEESIKAMRGLYGGWRCETAAKKADAAIAAIREALKQHRREWVGLTDEQLRQLAEKHLWSRSAGYEVLGVFEFARAIEARLEEKNCD